MVSVITHQSCDQTHFKEHFLFFKNCPILELSQLIEDLAGILYNNQITLVHGLLSADELHFKNWQQLINEQFDEPNWPIIRVNNPTPNELLTGYFYGISGVPVITLASDQSITKLFYTTNARYLFCGENIPGHKKSESIAQAHEVFDQFKTAFQFAEMNVEHLVQSWCFTPVQPEWMTEFSAFFNQSVSVNSFIGAETPHHTSLVASGWAIKPLNNSLQIWSVQAPDSFSAVEIKDENHSKLIISTIIPSNINDELTHFFDHLETILSQNGYEWKNLKRGVFWLQDMKYAKLLKQECKDRKIPLLPQLILQANWGPDQSMGSWEGDFVK